MEVLPCEHCTGMREIEVDAMWFLRSGLLECRVGRVAVSGAHVMVEDENLAGRSEQRAQGWVRRRNVDETDFGAGEFVGVERIVVAPRSILGVISPRGANGPGRSEPVRAPRVMKADSPHPREGSPALAARPRIPVALPALDRERTCFGGAQSARIPGPPSVEVSLEAVVGSER